MFAWPHLPSNFEGQTLMNMAYVSLTDHMGSADEMTFSGACRAVAWNYPEALHSWNPLTQNVFGSEDK